MTLPIEVKRWFNKKISDPSLKEDFIQREEQLVKKGRGIDRLSLPQPWADVTLYLIKYIKCEGRATIVFNYHFSLLNYLRYRQFINLPYILLENIRNMATTIKKTMHRDTCITNCGLIKIIVLDALSHQGRTGRNS